jgi:plasmid maintenance system antidote protein VapI
MTSMKQKQIAETLGIHKSDVCRILKSKRGVSQTMAESLKKMGLISNML